MSGHALKNDAKRRILNENAPRGYVWDGEPAVRGELPEIHLTQRKPKCPCRLVPTNMKPPRKRQQVIERKLEHHLPIGLRRPAASENSLPKQLDRDQPLASMPFYCFILMFLL